ncbi:MAG: LCP family protein [Ruminococcus sp.]|nr:LCP family protein [Ruminococcus sp.]
MNNTPNNDFEPTKPIERNLQGQPTQQELDSIEYITPVKKSKHKHKHSHKHYHTASNSSTPVSDTTKDDADDFVYARHHSKKDKKKKKAIKVLIIIACVLLALVIVAASTLFIFNSVGKSAMHNYKDMTIEPSPEIEKVEQVTNSGKTITYNGKTYSFNEDVATVVLMGIDTKDFENPDRVVGEGGQADAIYIAAIDTKSDKVSILGVSRDSMVDVNVYNLEGGFLRTENMQLCLSYAYGDSAHTSCENTLTSLERLFYGMQYNTYFSIDTRALETLTDTVGGVTLTSLVDFNSVYYSRTIKAGETVTLYGKDATKYVRERDTTELDSNNDRMARQKQFMTAFLSQIWGSVKSNPAMITDLYGTISDNSTTNLTPSKMTYLTTSAISMLDSYKEIEFVNVPGTVKKGEYAEFIVDENALMEIMLDLFYIDVTQ